MMTMTSSTGRVQTIECTTYTLKPDNIDQNDNTICPICREDILLHHVVMKVHCCFKNFHAPCLDPYFRKFRGTRCPLCRRNIVKTLPEGKKPSLSQLVVEVGASVAWSFENFASNRIMAEQLVDSFLEATVGQSSVMRQQIFSEIMSQYQERIDEKTRQAVSSVLLTDLEMAEDDAKVVQSRERPLMAIPGNLRSTVEPETSIFIDIPPPPVIRVRRRAVNCPCPPECKIMTIFIGIICLLVWGGYNLNEKD